MHQERPYTKLSEKSQQVSKNENPGGLCRTDPPLSVHSPGMRVTVPRGLSKQVPKAHPMSEEEWRRLGVQQRLGWAHYMIQEREPHILLFRRPLPKDQQK